MNTLILNAKVVNEGKVFLADLLISGDRIKKIAEPGTLKGEPGTRTINATGKFLLPGVIDDQVHFREPGLTHKGDIYSESHAAVAGGITSFMEMPNTNPQTLTQELLEDKYRIGEERSAANYSFFMGASNDNLAEVLKTDPEKVCGIKVFMGSSTGNMLVDKAEILEGLFRESKMLIATHCEDEGTIRKNLEDYKARYGDDIPVKFHPLIRSREACYKSSSMAVELAAKYGSRLHILHISTEEELSLFSDSPSDVNKKITSEACIHHLWFTDKDYDDKGVYIKWNPAVKESRDRDAIREAVKNGRIDIIATDHAPHLRSEKEQPYTKSASGGPLVQHSLVAMYELVKQGVFTMELLVEKMAHAPARIFGVVDRGFIREGYYADLVLLDPDSSFTVSEENILSKCGWSPFEGTEFSSTVTHTWVNGELAWENGKINEEVRGKRLKFNRS